jgi:hypothetical protein
MGFSNSKLAEKSCFLFRCNSSAEAAGILQREWGRFEKIHSSAKRSKRISLLFSSVKAVRFERAHPAMIKGIRSEVIDDITANGFNSTDGCGFCSLAFAQRIARQRVPSFRGQRYLPSVIQIRYR